MTLFEFFLQKSLFFRIGFDVDFSEFREILQKLSKPSEVCGNANSCNFNFDTTTRRGRFR